MFQAHAAYQNHLLRACTRQQRLISNRAASTTAGTALSFAFLYKRSIGQASSHQVDALRALHRLLLCNASTETACGVASMRGRRFGSTATTVAR